LTLPLLGSMRARVVAALSQRFPKTYFELISSPEVVPKGSPIISITAIRIESSTRNSEVTLNLSAKFSYTGLNETTKAADINSATSRQVSGFVNPENAVIELLESVLARFANSVSESASNVGINESELGSISGPVPVDHNIRVDIYLKGESTSHLEGLLSVVGWGSGFSMYGDPFTGELNYVAYSSVGKQTGRIPVSTHDFDRSVITGALLHNWRTFHYSYAFPVLARSEVDEFVLIQIGKGESRASSNRGELLFLDPSVRSSTDLGGAVSGTAYWLWFRPRAINGKVFLKKESEFREDISEPIANEYQIRSGYLPKWHLSRESFD